MTVDMLEELELRVEEERVWQEKGGYNSKAANKAIKDLLSYIDLLEQEIMGRDLEAFADTVETEIGIRDSFKYNS